MASGSEYEPSEEEEESEVDEREGASAGKNRSDKENVDVEGDGAEEGDGSDGDGDPEEAGESGEDGESVEESDEEADSEEEYEDDPRGRQSSSDAASDDSDAEETIEMVPEVVRETVTELIRGDACEGKCIVGKAAELGNFVTSLGTHSSKEKKCSMMAVLATQMALANARGEARERIKFTYCLPLVGPVCRDVFAAAYDISTASIARYRARIKSGAFHLQPHANTGNKAAQVMDVPWLKSWVEGFASRVGEVVPIRVRRIEKANGRVVRRWTSENHTLLPSYFTWEKLYEEMLLHVAESLVRRAEPSESAFRKIVQRECPNIRIRSPRDNVCDACTIYRNEMRGGNVTIVAESLGEHVQSARAMREEYKQDCMKASDAFIVLTIDYAQNLALPHVAETPSQWYFLSLVSVSVFGIHCSGTNTQTNYVYTERKGGKGSTEVISMLHKHLEPGSHNRELTVYADNCGGQNKNNFVVKFLLYLAHVGCYSAVNLKFFVRGHTKNACDRGFGVMKKKLARSDCWNLAQLREALEASSVSSKTVMLDNETQPFTQYKDVLNKLYKNLPAIQRYQTFRMTYANPGVVECKISPEKEADSFDLRLVYKGQPVTIERATEVMETAPNLPEPVTNPEKVRDIYKNVRPYVPAEFRDDPLYAMPTDAQAEASRQIKQKRAKSAADKRLAAATLRVEQLTANAVRNKADGFVRRKHSKKRKTRDENDESEDF